LNVIMILTNNPYPEEILKMCDGFRITGGNDIEPSYFGEMNEGLSKKVIPSLDELDKLIVEHAAKTGKPLLGICRGHQAINVFLGASVHQDIGDEHEKVKVDHVATMLENKLLNLKEKINIHTHHHQTVNVLAPGLEVIGFHDDGTIE